MIQIFATGGTFDKDYDFVTGKLYFKDSSIPDMLDRARFTVDYDLKTLMMIDSLEMNEADREIILHNCRRSDTEKIVITHGTDTMEVTAAYLAEKGVEGKTVVITGAMIPYAFGNSSDGFFNLGSALSFVQALPHGIYVVMNGRYFAWDEVEKNRKTGYFEDK